jgi:aerobic-type carbon monoxide dehydrogenase small subunit (CoxS/CutS family)
MNATINITVNGKKTPVSTDRGRTLLEVLREDLHLTGTKQGCREGRCGACTVLVDGRRVLSCQTLAVNVDKMAITTIEGLASGDALHPVQQAFLEEGALQCGYCTPGMILATVALLNSNPHPTDKEIIQGVNGNLCRCCGYPQILRAIRRAVTPSSEADKS